MKIKGFLAMLAFLPYPVLAGASMKTVAERHDGCYILTPTNKWFSVFELDFTEKEEKKEKLRILKKTAEEVLVLARAHRIVLQGNIEGAASDDERKKWKEEHEKAAIAEKALARCKVHVK